MYEIDELLCYFLTHSRSICCKETFRYHVCDPTFMTAENRGKPLSPWGAYSAPQTVPKNPILGLWLRPWALCHPACLHFPPVLWGLDIDTVDLLST